MSFSTRQNTMKTLRIKLKDAEDALAIEKQLNYDITRQQHQELMIQLMRYQGIYFSLLKSCHSDLRSMELQHGSNQQSKLLFQHLKALRKQLSTGTDFICSLLKEHSNDYHLLREPVDKHHYETFGKQDGLNNPFPLRRSPRLNPDRPAV